AFPRSFLNSLIIALATTLICVSFGAVSAYSLSRFVKRERQRVILLGLLTTRMIPVVSVLIPIYFALQSVGLLNTLAGLIIVYSGLPLPFVIWILEGYYRDFPIELEEAAAIDGCSPLRTFTSIVLPLSRNGLFAAAAFVFVSIWSDFIVGMTLTSSEKAWPISVALAAGIVHCRRLPLSFAQYARSRPRSAEGFRACAPRPARRHRLPHRAICQDAGHRWSRLCQQQDHLLSRAILR